MRKISAWLPVKKIDKFLPGKVEDEIIKEKHGRLGTH